jgi:hypothetical protein
MSPLPLDDWRAAGRLLHWGLRPTARPEQEPEYHELINHYLDHPSFQTAVQHLAQGLGLHIVDASERGLVLAPVPESVFAMTPSAFRVRAQTADERLLDGLVEVGIAAALYPRPGDLLEDATIARPPVSVDDVELTIRQLCSALSAAAKEHPDPAADDIRRGLLEAWRVYEARPSARETPDGRQGLGTTRRLIETHLEKLREVGCFTRVTREGVPAYQPTWRYQVQVQQFAAGELFQAVQELLQAPATAASKVS